MSSRTYLSIGDVLTLLREEFPDVTISKIRFLESQGLVNPERSPSGYRKFFDHDVERLRWVLRQQREHFLPLKVIRDRLAEGGLDEAGETNGNGSVATATVVDEQPTKADEEAMARILADASRRTALLPESVPAPAEVRRGLQIVEDVPTPDVTRHEAPLPVGNGAAVGRVTPVHQGAASKTSSAPTPMYAVAAASSGGATGPSGSTSEPEAKTPAEPATPTTPANASAAATGGGKSAKRAAAAAAKGSGDEPAAGAVGGTTSMVTGASMTAEELCAASGLSAEELAGLEGFGLVVPVLVAGIANYDEDALTMANLAAQFRTYGIEARHLRMYRNAVDRELGLIEQVIIPLLRQRNPEARQRALETSDQLAALGQSMRATLLRQALRQHLGG